MGKARGTGKGGKVGRRGLPEGVRITAPPTYQRETLERQRVYSVEPGSDGRWYVVVYDRWASPGTDAAHAQQVYATEREARAYVRLHASRPVRR